MCCHHNHSRVVLNGVNHELATAFIEMVGGLVEKQNLWLSNERNREPQSRPLPAGNLRG